MEEIFNKSALIDELRQIHKDMVSVYRNLFKYKYEKDENFKCFIEDEHKENGISKDKIHEWNDNFCHRASYTLINKILFIRICEDKRFMRNSEDYILGEVKEINIGKKLSARGRDKWINLISNYTLGELLQFAFADMRESFKNIALYKVDKYEKLNPSKQELEFKFKIDKKEYEKTPFFDFEEEVAAIIEKLDTSKFDFDVKSEGNILGDVYEKFMDRESRKAIGQFYTPDFVIENILNNTVVKADIVENPYICVLDPACGSGHFLIMAYDILKEKFEKNLETLREKYANEDYEYKTQVLKGKDYWVKDKLHYHILKYCIYGADIDSFAIQLTTINLLLKDLDNFTDDLNIIECDSLIIWEEDYEWGDLKKQLSDNKLYYTVKHKDSKGVIREELLNRDKAQELVKLCEFWTKGFDFVVGNPPYMGQKGNKEIFEKFKENNFWMNYYERKQDIYYYFIIRGLESVNENGKLGFINPPYWLTAYATKNLKKYILKNAELVKVYDFSNEKIFDDAQIDGNIFIFNKTNERKSQIEIYKYDKEKGDFTCYNSKYSNKDLNIGLWNIFNQEEKQDYFTNIKIKKLGDIATISPGIQTGCDKVSASHIKKLGLSGFNVNEGIYILTRKEKDRLSLSRDEMKYIRPFYKNSQIGKYFSDTETEQYIIITNEINDIDKLPNIKKHLLRYKTILDNRYRNYALIKADKEGKWYSLYGYRPNTNFDTNKIVTPYRSKLNRFSYSDSPLYGSIDLFYIDINDIDFSIYYVLGILNSDLILYWLQNNCKKKGENLELYAEPLSFLPIRICEDGIQYEIIDTVKKIIDLKKKYYNSNKILSIINGAEIIKNHIENSKKLNEIMQQIMVLENDLNELIYGIYQISFSERKSIEQFLIENVDSYKKYISEKERIVQNSEIIDLSDLYSNIREYLKDGIEKILQKNIKYMSVEYIRDNLKNEFSNFEELINIMRKDKVTKKSIDIVKDVLNEFTDTWSQYIKSKLKDAEHKPFISYYDNNYYGLSEWDDESHREYFIDAIKEYTDINPNEKRAKDILKQFEGLDVKDKEDYIDMFNLQIKKAFKK